MKVGRRIYWFLSLLGSGVLLCLAPILLGFIGVEFLCESICFFGFFFTEI